MVATPTRKTASTSTQDKHIQTTVFKPEVLWEKLPEDFVLPDDPVDNINQPAIAAALTESLNLAGLLSETAATTTNYGICSKVDGKTVVKAPDWAWIPAISVSKSEIERSYTPVLEGDIPIIAMEFISLTEGGEYSIKPTYPPGKWFYYERILQIPNYIIFNPKDGLIEHYKLSDEEDGRYVSQQPNEQGRYWLSEANLFLGLWEGLHQDRSGYWLRWWTADGELLLWGEELAEQNQQEIKQEKQRAKQEKQRADKAEEAMQKAIAKLVDMGLSVEQVAETLNTSVESVNAVVLKQQ